MKMSGKLLLEKYFVCLYIFIRMGNTLYSKRGKFGHGFCSMKNNLYLTLSKSYCDNQMHLKLNSQAIRLLSLLYGN